jgi:hypothetical protein
MGCLPVPEARLQLAHAAMLLKRSAPLKQLRLAERETL